MLGIPRLDRATEAELAAPKIAALAMSAASTAAAIARRLYELPIYSPSHLERMRLSHPGMGFNTFSTENEADSIVFERRGAG